MKNTKKQSTKSAAVKCGVSLHLCDKIVYNVFIFDRSIIRLAGCD